jgi:AraC-like DNA-binding protein
MPTDQNSPPISTILTPDERSSVDAAGRGLYETLHRDSTDEVSRDVRERRAAAVVFSVARCVRETMNVAGLMREFPRIPAIALLSTTEPAASHAVLSLGQSGVRTLIDVRAPNGWRALRKALVDSSPIEISRLALDALAVDLSGVSTTCWEFFDILFSTTPPIAKVQAFAPRLHLTPSELASQLYHAQLPPARAYLSLARMTRAARLLENPGLSIANVANLMEYSSPQAFGRHVGVMLQVSASTFRRTYDGVRMLELFRHRLVLPYIDGLRRFDPR